MQEIHRFMGWEDSLGKGMTYPFSILAWGIPRDRAAWWAAVHGRKESDTAGKKHSKCIRCYIPVLFYYILRDLATTNVLTDREFLVFGGS